MIYFLHGTDTDAVRTKARDMVASMHKKKPEAEIFKMTSENWGAAGEGGAARLDELAGGQGLFEKKYIVLLDRVGEDVTAREELVDRIDQLADSEHIFIWCEGKLDKATRTKIEKRAEKTQEFEKAEKIAASESAGKFSAGGTTSIFALGDALGRRDKKQLWVLYRQFVDAGKSPEEIHGTLFWQAKSMVLASRSATAGEAGLAPFVYTKSKGFSRNYTEAELTKLLDNLIAVSHDARRGKHEMETGLERLLLEI